LALAWVVGVLLWQPLVARTVAAAARMHDLFSCLNIAIVFSKWEIGFFLLSSELLTKFLISLTGC
jgi:hypothetical protein